MNLKTPKLFVENIASGVLVKTDIVIYIYIPQNIVLAEVCVFWKTNVVFLAGNLNQFFINFQFTRDLEFLKLDGKYQRPLVERLKDVESI